MGRHVLRWPFLLCAMTRPRNMSINKLCEWLSIDNDTRDILKEAGLSNSDELLEVAPNDRELLEGFGITNRTYRTKLVAWMLTVLKRQAAEEAAGGLQTPRFAGQYLQKRTGTGGSVTPRAA